MLLLIRQTYVSDIWLLLVIGIVFCANVHEVNEPELKVVIEEVVLDVLFKLFFLDFKLCQIFDDIWVRLELIGDVFDKL